MKDTQPTNEALVAIAKGGGEAAEKARNLLWERNAGLAYQFAGKYHAYIRVISAASVDLDIHDLALDAMLLALPMSIAKFDEGMGVKFITLYGNALRFSIQKVGKAELNWQRRMACKDPDDKEFALMSGSYDEPIHELIRNEDESQKRRTISNVMAAVRNLNDRKQAVLQHRMAGKSLRETAALVGVSAERIRQLEHRALQAIAVAVGRNKRDVDSMGSVRKLRKARED